MRPEGLAGSPACGGWSVRTLCYSSLKASSYISFLPCRKLWKGRLPVASSIRRYRAGLDQEITGLLGLNYPFPSPPLSPSHSRTFQSPVIHAPAGSLPWLFPLLGLPSFPFETGRLPTHLSGHTMCHFLQEAFHGLLTRSNPPLQPLLE